MPQQGYTKQSTNLRRRINDARIAITGAWQAAFMDVYESELPVAKDILVQNALIAIEATEEFDDILFTEPLLKILDIDELYVILPDEQTQKVSVFLDMETHAGNVREYFEAVSLARIIGGFGGGDPAMASFYWKNYLYGPAREGTIMRTEQFSEKQIRLYWETLSLRIGGMAGKAPWWQLLETGNNSYGSGGGTPYPSYSAQRFVEKSERSIQVLFDVLIEDTYERYLERVAVEGINSTEVADKISKVVAEVIKNPKDYKAGDIIKEIHDRGRAYTLYISRTGQLGYALRPRF